MQRFTEAPSPLAGVSAGAWRRFCAALEVQGLGDVSASGGLGCYDIRPRRLLEIGYAKGLRYVRTPANRQIYQCEFALPRTQAKFLADMVSQQAALTKSMVAYQRAIAGGELVKPEGLSLAGALSILHRGGRGALAAWPELFDDTRALYEKTREIF